jgi:hypothetical protein
MVFFKLAQGFKSLGQRIAHGAGEALNKVRQIGENVHNEVKKVPVVGGLVAEGLEKLYNTPVYGGMSAKNAFDTANKAVEVGKGLFSDDEAAKSKALGDIKQIGKQAQAGTYGSKAQQYAQRGTEAVDKLKSIVS